MQDSATQQLTPPTAGTSLADPPELHLTLTVTDPDVYAELEGKAAGSAREDFANHALKIEVIALRAAQDRLDVARLRSEGERIVVEVEEAVGARHAVLVREISSTLANYFDPETGRFAERVQRLVRKDGELEEILRRPVGATDSELAKTLQIHLGEDSVLLRRLDLEASDGFLRRLIGDVELELTSQRERILAEFSLDKEDGALARLVRELDRRHGKLQEALDSRVSSLVSEFSLDREDSALSRLVGRIEQTRSQIRREFSLEEEDSALYPNA